MHYALENKFVSYQLVLSNLLPEIDKPFLLSFFLICMYNCINFVYLIIQLHQFRNYYYLLTYYQLSQTIYLKKYVAM